MASGGGEEGEFGLQIAPMLDILFVLLLFFMVSAGANEKEQELGVKVPGTGPGKADGTKMTPIVIRIDADGSVFFNDTPTGAPNDALLMDLRSMLERMVQAYSNPEDQDPVIISPSARTPHNRIVSVLDAASYAKVKKLSFRAPPDGAPK
jgi:biopolymer transport protein ExbD